MWMLGENSRLYYASAKILGNSIFLQSERENESGQPFVYIFVSELRNLNSYY